MAVKDCKGRLRLCGFVPRTLALISIKLSPNISGFQSVKKQITDVVKSYLKEV